MSIGKQTERNASEILTSKYDFYKPTSKQKKQLLIKFAEENKVIYGKAFDLIKLKSSDAFDEDFDFADVDINDILLYEMKSTKRDRVDDDFNNYFFGLTTAELLVAQNLKNNYRFVFVNINTENIIELSLEGIFKKAKGIYPTWSIQF